MWFRSKSVQGENKCENIYFCKETPLQFTHGFPITVFLLVTNRVFMEMVIPMARITIVNIIVYKLINRLQHSSTQAKTFQSCDQGTHSTHILTHSYIYSLTRSLIPPFIRSLTRSLIHSLVHEMLLSCLDCQCFACFQKVRERSLAHCLICRT